jgi:hypothetical protein
LSDSVEDVDYRTPRPVVEDQKIDAAEPAYGP